MLEEFKKFALRGNVVDLAVGVIIGAAFGAIVQFAGRRHHHAGGRGGHRRPRFFQLLHSAVGQGHGRHAWSRQKSKAPCWLGAIFSPSRSTSSSSLSCCFWSIRGMNRHDAKGSREGAAGVQAGTTAHRNPRPAQSRAERISIHGRKTRAPLQGGRRQPQGALQLRDRRGLRGRHRAHRQRGQIAARRQGDDRGILRRRARRRNLADQFQYSGISAGAAASITRRSGRANCCCISARSTSWPARSSARA